MALTWRAHPILKPPTDAEMAVMEAEDLLRLHALYHEAIVNSENDPYRYIFVLEPWKKAEKLLNECDTLLVLGGNKAAKTFLGAWLVMKTVMENPGSLVICFAQNDETSRIVQQPAIYHMLPAELKSKKLGTEEYISYSRQNGFAGRSLILPNDSRIIFKTYSQYQLDQTILEGMDMGSVNPVVVNLGCWCDEYLGGPELVDTLMFRLGQRNAKLLLTFTPIDGYTEMVRQYLDGAKTLESRVGELLKDKRRVPVVQRCRDKDAHVLYIHTNDNPWGGYERIAKDALAKDDEAWVLCRIYGVPTKSMATKFPSFSREVNVIKHEDIPFVKDAEKNPVTLYMVLDPAGSKKWFMAWIAVDATDTWWVYREWPGEDVGDWAEWKYGKWCEGPGARRDGYIEGIPDYIEHIMNLERPMMETLQARLIDPRFGAAKYQGKNGVSTLIDDLAEMGMTFIPAPGLEEKDGIQLLQDKMAYNIRKPIDASNRPHFYISDKCENIIRAIQEYTGESSTEPWKDCIDVIRYAAVDRISYIDLSIPHVTSTGRGGY